MSNCGPAIIFRQMTQSPKPSSDIFVEKALDLRRARLAYPLVRMSRPSISMEEWIAFVRRWVRLSPQQGGIMSIGDKRGYLHALFTYRLDQNLQLGCFVRIGDIIAGHLPGELLNRSIIASADRLAARIGCKSIVIEPAADGAAVRAMTGTETKPFGFLRMQPRRRMAAV
jgi:hypothetical protein